MVIDQQRHVQLWMEFLGLYVGIPLAVATVLRGRPFFPILWLAAMLSLGLLLRERDFDRRRFTRLTIDRRYAVVMIVRALVAVALVSVVMMLTRPQAFLLFPRLRPRLWLLVMVLYPVLSVYPQGIIYRGLFFERYAGLFPGEKMRWIAGGVVFALGHVIFASWWSLVLTFIGGLLFVQTYRRTGSLLIAAMEHAFYGCAMFTLGLGSLFYHGAER